MSGPERLSPEDSLEGDTTARRRRGDGRPATCSLRVILGDKVSAYPVPMSGEITLGRGGDVVIAHVNVSRLHVTVRVGPSLEVSDLGSTNLTTLFGSPLEPHAWIPIRCGDVLVVGGEALAMLHDGDLRSVPKRHMGREVLEREVAQAALEYERTGRPFGVCTVSSRASCR